MNKSTATSADALSVMPSPEDEGLLLSHDMDGQDAAILRQELKHRIVGQNDAIGPIADLWQMHQSGLSSGTRPVGSFLLLGPTGTGKTRCCESIAEVLTGSLKNLIKIDCAEFQFGHEIAKLIGAPPGYLGHRETKPLLSQEILLAASGNKNGVSIVLFDEIEKAGDSLWHLLLGILDKGTLTLGDNRKVDFRKSMIFMTSNLGASEMSKLIEKGMGFAQTAKSVKDDFESISKSSVGAAKKKFTSEFVNRLDKMIVFKPLSIDDIAKILTLELADIQKRIIDNNNKSFVLDVDSNAREYITANGFDTKYGARYLKRVLDRLIVSPVAAFLSNGKVVAGDYVKVGYTGGEKLQFKVYRKNWSTNRVLKEAMKLICTDLKEAA